MSEMTATVTKTAKGSINVKGYEQLDYNFHYVTDVFDVKHQKLAECYERWQRVLIIIDTSEFSSFQLLNPKRMAIPSPLTLCPSAVPPLPRPSFVGA
jgi:hypothetical protein